VIRRSRDPFDRPDHLLRGLYGYVAYRVGSGPEAEDLTSAAFERGLRYRSSYDATRGSPLTWLIGIARREITDSMRAPDSPFAVPELFAESHEPAVVDKVVLHEALARLPGRDRDLIALRYGAELSAKEIAVMLGETTNGVEVALHRARARLRAELEIAA
jgi:RNA polymerase sigma-70 factor (ECF subfamily)